MSEGPPLITLDFFYTPSTNGRETMDLEDPFTSHDDVFTWISRFINLERGQTGKSFRLDRMEYLAQRAQHPEGVFPLIHVAGSKGKGSVTTMMASILHEAGFRTGRYVSPHVIEYRERVSLADRFFDEEVYSAAGNELWTLVEKAVREHPQLFDPDSPEGESPTSLNS